MLIVGGLDLGSLINRSEPDLAGAIRAWRAEIHAASWMGRESIAARYPKAEFGKDDHILFDIGHSHCALIRANYAVKVVQMKFIGPRAAAPWPVRKARSGSKRP